MNIHLSDQPFTQRQLRVGELLKQLLGNLFLKEEVALPNINTRVITVSEVRMSPDLKHAKVFFMPLGGKNSEFILQSLERKTSLPIALEKVGRDLFGRNLINQTKV